MYVSLLTVNLIKKMFSTIFAPVSLLPFSLVVQIVELGPPWGNCSVDPKYNRASCVLGCLSDGVIKRCGCRAPYMTGKTLLSC